MGGSKRFGPGCHASLWIIRAKNKASEITFRAMLSGMALSALLQLAFMQLTCGQLYSNLGTGYCRDGNGLYPNVYCRTAGYSIAACQARCDSDLACVAFQVGIGLNTSCCIYGSATIDTAPLDWDFGYGNGGTDNITQAVSFDRVCYKRATCASNSDCIVELEAGSICQDSFCQSTTPEASDAWSMPSNFLLVAIITIGITAS